MRDRSPPTAEALAAAARRRLRGLGAGWLLASVAVLAAIGLLDVMLLSGAPIGPATAAAVLLRAVALHGFAFLLLRRLAGARPLLPPGVRLPLFFLGALLLQLAAGMPAALAKLAGLLDGIGVFGRLLILFALVTAMALVLLRPQLWLAGIATGAPWRDAVGWQGGWRFAAALAGAWLTAVTPVAAVHAGLTALALLSAPDSLPRLALALVDAVAAAAQLLLSSSLLVTALAALPPSPGALRAEGALR